MRIEVTYVSEPSRIIETTGESLLSGSGFERAPEWSRGDTRVPLVAVQLRPRTDIACQDGAPLMVEVTGWSCSDASAAGYVSFKDMGRKYEAQRLCYHVFRVWEVLPASELSRAVDIRIDHRIHLMRLDGRLVDLTPFETLAARVIGEAGVSAVGLARRVCQVHAEIKKGHRDITDKQIGDFYGLGDWLYRWATTEIEGKPNLRLEDMRPPFVNEVSNSLDAFCDDLRAASAPQDVENALDDLVLDVPDITLRRLKVELERRGVEVEGLDSLWERVVG